MNTKYHHGNLKEILAKEGLSLIREEGIDKLSLRKVAQKAGVSHTAPYRHFKDKQALIIEITTRGYRLFNKELVGAVEKVENPIDKLQALTAAYISFAFGNEDYYRLIFGKSLPKDQYSESLLKESLRSFHLLRDLLGKAYQLEDPDKQALFSWSQLHGLIILYLDRKLPIKYLDMTGKEFVRMVLPSLQA